MSTERTGALFRLRTWAVPVLASILTASGSAQTTVTIGSIQYIAFPEPGECSVMGQWLGPYNFGGTINPGLRGEDPNEEDDRDWAEIAHAVVLPPFSDVSPYDYSRRVLLLCRRADLDTTAHPATGGDIAYRSFIWDKLDPGDLTEQVIDSGYTGGARDPFCGGHTLTRGGNVFVMGGVNQVSQVQHYGDIYGNAYAFLFVNKQTPYWVSGLPQMQFSRWYPSPVRMGNGSILVTGHEHNPDPTAGQYRERAVVNDSAETLTWQTYTSGSTTQAYQLNIAGPSCSSTTAVDLHAYPRLHLTGEGSVLSATQDSRVLEFNVCTSDTLNPDRFESILSTDTPDPDASTVHYIDLTPSTGPAEYVYAIGGSVPGIGYHTLGSKRVLMMDVDQSNPASSTWSDSAAPDLQAGRLYSNAVLMLDGSITVIGGVTQDSSLNEVYLKHPETYKPPGIFNTGSTGWDYQNSQTHPRTYHSVAVLLPQGDIFSAGGQGTSVFTNASDPDRVFTPVDAWYSVELFQPPYMCSTYRPVITSVPTTMQIGQTGIQLGVKLQSTASGGETRVALIGPGSATHAMDSNQVYIKLPLDNFTPNGVPTQVTTLEVDAPPTLEYCPPGWYLLAVVNAEGFPSIGKWIKVIP